MKTNIKPLTIIGTMSGTSGDGIDVALIKTDGKEFLEAGVGKTYQYDFNIAQEAQKLVGQFDLEKLLLLEKQITQAHAIAIKQFLGEQNINSKQVDLVALHGHTVAHYPQHNCTLQLGNPNLLASDIKIDVIADFRKNDMAYGGQGAPLVPIYHKALAKNIGGTVAVINIGGVANITYIDGDEIIAFDTGPGCALLDDFIQGRTGKPYDDNGALSGSGMVDQNVIGEFLKDSYFSLPIPRSLDRNHFVKYIKFDAVDVTEGAAAIAAMTYLSIAQGIKDLPAKPEKIIVAGGGRKNKVFINGLSQALGQKVYLSEDFQINGDMLEAHAFGYLAARSFYNLPITYPKTTGASQPVSGGVFCRA